MCTTSSAELKKTVSARLCRSGVPKLSDHFPKTGSGAVYSFDPVGSYEREACRAAGAAQSLVQPFLDNQVSVFLTRNEACQAFFSPILRRFRAAVLTRTLFYHLPDLLQEPAGRTRGVSSVASTASPRSLARHRLFHLRNGTAHRGSYTGLRSLLMFSVVL